jgi:hypothetical protein
MNLTLPQLEGGSTTDFTDTTDVFSAIREIRGETSGVPTSSAGLDFIPGLISSYYPRSADWRR